MQTVAVLGTGIMGAPMARNLLEAGFDVRVWNRTADKARALADAGATVAETPGEAAEGAEVLLTMLSDGPAVDSVVWHRSAPLSALARRAIWLQMGTVGLEWTRRLAQRAKEASLDFVDAPVLGTRAPAEQGTLIVLAGGPSVVLDRCHDVFEAVGSKVHRFESVGGASRMKLVLNSWIVSLVTALAEAVALAEALDVSPERFLEIIDGGPIGPPYARVKGGAMVGGDFQPSFPLELALKDARLVAEAADAAGVDAAVVRAVIERMSEAVDAGHGREDMAAVVAATRRRRR